MIRDIRSDTNSITTDADWLVNLFRIRNDTQRIMKRSQLRAARALLEWSQDRLAEVSGVSVPTIKRLEPGDGPITGRYDTIDKLRRALEAAGVIFVQENGDGSGVRLRKTGAAGHAHALEHAEAAADRQLARVDAPEEEKARRKRIVTQVSKKMRTKT